MRRSIPCSLRERHLTGGLRNLTLLLLLLLCGACASGYGSRDGSDGPSSEEEENGPSSGPPEITEIPEAPPEVLETALAEVDETEIRAAFVDDDLEVTIPLSKKGAGELSGRIEVTLVNAQSAEPVEVGSRGVKFEQDEDEATHRVVIRDLPMTWVRGQTGTLVLDWTVETDDDEEALRGQRSLYMALGPLEIQLRGPTQLSRGEPSPLRVLVRNRLTQRVIEDAVVSATLVATDVEDADGVELLEGVTDSFGEFVDQLLLPEEVTSGQVRVDVSHEDGQVWTAMTVRVDASEQRLHLSADKTIYKPGQDIELRVLALDGPERTPIEGSEATFEAFDGKGLKVFRRVVETDEYGVAAVTLPTDTRVNEGNWTINAMVAGARRTLNVPVRRYILPKMQVEVVPAAPFVLAGEPLLGTVEARYLFGEPVADATVTVTASGAGVALQQTGTTDEAGTYQFELATPAQVVQNVPVSLAVTLTDPAGQKETGSGQVIVASQPVAVQAFTEHEPIVRGVENRMLVVVSDAIGRPLVTDVNIAGIEDEPVVVTTNAHGVAALEFVPDGALNLRVEAEDGAGRRGEYRRILGVADAPPFSIVADRALYAPGDDARLSVYGEEGLERVFVDLFRGAAGVASLTVELEDGYGEVVVPITGDMGGLLVAEAQAPTADGSMMLTTMRLLVESEKRLRVNLVPSSESVAPGEEVGFELEVTDTLGNPQVASVGLNVVNEASFALGGEPINQLETSFALDTRLLSSNTNVLGKTRFDLLNMAPSDERDLLARALFSRGEAMADSGTSDLPRFDYNSAVEELPQIQLSMRTKVAADANTLVNTLRNDFNFTVFEPEEWFDAVETMANRMRDPFGQEYQVTVDRVSRTLTMLSFGPDEEQETPDDGVAVVSLFLPSPPIAPTNQSSGPGAGIATPGAAVEMGAPPMAAAPDDFAIDDENAGQPAPQGPAEAGGRAAQPPGVAVRSDFRETVYSNPTLITDAAGRASVSFPVAHSITTWRASADGSTAEGHLGSGRATFRTFQSFFVDFDMPTQLTQGDELELPVIVYNYLAEDTDVEVALQAGDWLELLSDATQVVSLGPSEVRAVKFAVRVAEAGNQTVTLQGTAGEVSDALRRVVSVEPDGQPDDETVSGTLDDEGGTVAFSIPVEALAGGTSVQLTLTPGFEAEAAKGVESMLREPNGCFEQTMSSAWPNVMVAAVLEQTGQLSGEEREATLAMLTRGYQRLLTFESPTGGYNWWGDGDPGNRILSAIMLWHLKDVEELIEIDDAVRTRTLSWLLTQQNPDGTWDAGDALHAGNESLGTSVTRTTAFIAWALAHTGWADDAVASATMWLSENELDQEDVYASALVANALTFGAPTLSMTSAALTGLDSLGQAQDDGSVTWTSSTPSWTGGYGDAATTEVTALAAYALLHDGGFAASTLGAVKHVIASKDSVGTWYNTQATMNALRVLSASIQPEGADAAGTLTVMVNGQPAHEIEIDPEQNDVFRTFDLGEYAQTGDNTVELAFDGDGEFNFQITRRVYLPMLPAPEGPLALDVSLSSEQAVVGEPITVQVRATNNEDTGSRDQVIVRVGRAPGFVPNQDDLQQLVNAGQVSRFEVREDDVTLYLMNLAAGETRALAFRTTPNLVVDAIAPSSEIYAYYQPSLKQVLEAQRVTVAAR